VPKRDYKFGMFVGFKSMAQGIWRVAFAAGAGAAVLLICVVACAFTLVSAPPKLRA
jgi:hypothetical protein